MVRAICAHLGAPEPSPEPLSDLPVDAPLAPSASSHAPDTIRINTISGICSIRAFGHDTAPQLQHQQPLKHPTLTNPLAKTGRIRHK
jgi:hypothetical protein